MSGGASGVLAPHTRQHVLGRAQTDEEGEGHEPDADSEVRRDFGEGGIVVVVVVVVG